MEKDPNGKDLKESGAKADAGKVRLDLVIDGFASSLWEVARVSTHGAEKYSEGGWKDVPDAIKRYKSAMYRHMNAEAKGEVFDQDSKLLHAAHAAWNALAYLHFTIQESRVKPSQCEKLEAHMPMERKPTEKLGDINRKAIPASPLVPDTIDLTVPTPYEYPHRNFDVKQDY